MTGGVSVGSGLGTGCGLELGDAELDGLGAGDDASAEADPAPGLRVGVGCAARWWRRARLLWWRPLFLWCLAFGWSVGSRLTPSWSGVMPAYRAPTDNTSRT